MAYNEALDPRSSWWSSLRHGGMLIAASRLADHFPAELPPLSRYVADRLRSAVQLQKESGSRPSGEFLDVVLEDVLALDSSWWSKASAVDSKWSHRATTGELLKPRRVWESPEGTKLFLFAVDSARLGIGHGRRDAARVVEWLRRSSQPFALLTNGRQWRLIHAGADYDAWCEWDIDFWFEEGQPGPQLEALRILLSRDSLESKLREAIAATRRGQAELSDSLGERVRTAVEHLIHSSAPVIDLLQAEQATVQPRDVYIAATRIIMRCVVILFAEARTLLPRDNPVYNDSYSLQGLREQLDRAAHGRGKERLRRQIGAWPRMLSLFRLVYAGSPHEQLPVVAYRGGLFEPGSPDAADPVLRAIAAFESSRNRPSDFEVHRILELLTRSLVKVRQRNASVWVESPIDFSDLSSEYIGILYEGLLDFQLRRADAPVIFLNIGDQPALPFLQLDALAPDALAKMFEGLKKAAKGEDSEADSEDEEESEEAEETAAETEPVAAEVADPEEPDDTDQGHRDRVHQWARKAALAAKLVRPLRGKPDTRKQQAYEQELDRQARGIVGKLVLPGEWYLVREGGTRKGSGTFYTRPQLAGPITRRALGELVAENGVPVTPERILSLRICDPAMGSGSFLLSALRYLTESLVESLYHHRRFDPQPDRTICRLADGLPADDPSQETLPVPIAHESFEDRLRARLRRHIVERCIYGVDMDPLAVELARLSLWVETMDPRLPFGFLDHKLKWGNALVGCWFDRFQDYPVMAWEREGGDANHDRFVHHFRLTPKGTRSGDKWTDAIKQHKKKVAAEIRNVISAGEAHAFDFMLSRMSRGGVHDHLVAVYDQMHSLPVHETEQRKKLYDTQIAPGSAYSELKRAFDTWCAIWFWPGDQLETAPMPGNFLKPTDETRDTVAILAAYHRFFHWELEFPDVFTGLDSGFDAIIGNPPWEITKPISKEFFSNIDPMYRGYGKQEALDRQQEYFQVDPRAEHNWIAYGARIKALSNWTKYAGKPFGDAVWEDSQGRSHHDFPLDSKFTKSENWHAQWKRLREKRGGYADPQHPYLWQGSADINTYKMFLELGHSLLRPQGRLALLVPSGIYSDQGTGALRRLFLEKARWSFLYAFQNERFIFPSVDHRFKVAALLVVKSAAPGPLLTRFRLGPGDSPEASELEADFPDSTRYLSVSLEQITRFSPNSGAILEVRSASDLHILEKLYTSGVLLGDQSPDGWQIRYNTEFHMTNDSKLFPPRTKWEDKGYRPDEYGHWLLGGWRRHDGPREVLKRSPGLVLSADGGNCIDIDSIEDVALPLVEGRIVEQFDFSFKGWVSGKGRRAVWRELLFDHKVFEPQFLMGLHDYRESEAGSSTEKLTLRDVTSSTNSRTVLCSVVPDFPCGHKSPVLGAIGSMRIGLVGVLNSFVVDWVVRQRLATQSLTLGTLAEIAVPLPQSIPSGFDLVCERLSLPHLKFAPAWVAKRGNSRWFESWAITSHERIRGRAILEATVGNTLGLGSDEFRWILRDCDHSIERLESKSFSRTLDPKGFWRFEKDKPPELRLAVLAQVAFADLCEKGLDAFLNQNDGEGWMLPETLRLADYNLGHDDRAKEPQPVAAALGERFRPWQLSQTVEESWEECERHAELIRKILRQQDPEQLQEATANADQSGKQMGLF